MSSLFAFGSPGEIFVVFLVILLLFGAKKIPELARSLGRASGEFKKAKTTFDEAVNESANENVNDSTTAEESKKIAPPAAESNSSEDEKDIPKKDSK